MGEENRRERDLRTENLRLKRLNQIVVPDQ